MFSSLSSDIFELTLNALPDGVLLVDAKRRVIFANTAFMEQWNLPADLRAGRDEAAMLRHSSEQLIEPESFLREVERLHSTGEAPEDELYLKDGRILARRSVPFLVQNDLQLRVWIFTDITDARSSMVDPLVGLPNRRAFSKVFPRLASGYCDGLLKCIAVLDIDNFKAYNDHYGHAAGDEVLRRVGSVLKAELSRNDDYIFRIGGEEFLLGCRARRVDEAVEIIDRVCRAIAASGIDHQRNPPSGVVTASIGFVTFRGAAAPDVIFDHADAALYQAKSEGRNRICKAEFSVP